MSPDKPSTVRAPAPWMLAARQLRRDLRAGELRLLLVAVTLAVAALAAVGFFADRLERGLARDARQLLGGDALVASDHPTPQALMDEARRRGFRETYLHAQSHARDFYARHGYVAEGDEYLEAGIPHIGMRATLRQ